MQPAANRLRGNRCNRSFGWVGSTPEVAAAVDEEHPRVGSGGNVNAEADSKVPFLATVKQALQRNMHVAQLRGPLASQIAGIKVTIQNCRDDVSPAGTSSMLKLAGFCRGGNSLKLEIHLATNSCAGTRRKTRCAISKRDSVLTRIAESPEAECNPIWPHRIPEERKDVFGDEEARKDASPVPHVRPELNAFLLANTDNDSPGHNKPTREFADALKVNKVIAEAYEVKDRAHGSRGNPQGLSSSTQDKHRRFTTRAFDKVRESGRIGILISRKE
jgi:hypothetical protein